MSQTYKNAGVDVEAGYEVVQRIKPHVARTMRTGVLNKLGSFAGLFDLSALNIKEPVLVSGTDGVGTKLKLAFELDRHDTIGIDAVAMCVNDIITQGAEPLFFLDYIATNKVIPSKIEEIVKGLSEGCIQSGCALIGGETAEMPDMYNEGEYDIAGFAVGVVEKQKIITGQDISEGDILIGLPSTGVHSNGFSLIRKIVKNANLDLNKIYFGNQTLGEVLLRPTKIYSLDYDGIKGMSHITGGGFIENIPRMLPEGLAPAIKKGTWEVPEIFSFLQKHGDLVEDEMYNIFNMGIGMVLAVSSKDVAKFQDCYVIGEVRKGEGLMWA